jgi:hypothetical protein
MKALHFYILFSLASALCFADSWTGKLVDTNCAEQNQGISQNKAAPCTPTAKTISFGLETGDGKVFKLDAAGNAKAASMLRSGKGDASVTVSGAMNGETVKVDSISAQ